MSDRRFGIVCAVPEEYEAIAGRLEEPVRETHPHGETCRGRLSDSQVIVSECGVGKVNVAMASTWLHVVMKCDPIMFCGVAGGIDPDLGIGDIVIADRVVQHDCGVIEDGMLAPYQAGHVPFFNPTDQMGYDASTAMMTAIRTCLQDYQPEALHDLGIDSGDNRLVYGTIVSGDQFINCESTRRTLYTTYDAAAVEMEGGVLGQVAEKFGFNWINIRTLSDLAGGSAKLDFPRFVEQVSARSAELVVNLIPGLDAALQKEKS